VVYYQEADSAKLQGLSQQMVCNTKFTTASQTEAEVKIFPMASLPLASLMLVSAQKSE